MSSDSWCVHCACNFRMALRALCKCDFFFVCGSSGSGFLRVLWVRAAASVHMSIFESSTLALPKKKFVWAWLCRKMKECRALGVLGTLLMIKNRLSPFKSSSNGFVTASSPSARMILIRHSKRLTTGNSLVDETRCS